MWNLGQFREKWYLNFPSKFCVFTVKSPSVTKRSVNEESAFKKSENPSAFFFFFFFSPNYRLNSFFYTSWKQLQVIEIAKFEFSVTVHCGLGEKAPGCDPLSSLKLVCILCMLCLHIYCTFLCLYTMVVTLLAKTQLYELTILGAYNGDVYNYYRPMVPKLLIII